MLMLNVFCLLDTLHPKRRRTSTVKAWDVESEQEEHSLSLSQNSSPSLSDQEQTATHKAADSVRGSQGFHLFKRIKETPSNCQSHNIPSKQKELGNGAQRTPKDLQLLGEVQTQLRQEQFLHSHNGRNSIQFPTVGKNPLFEAGPIQNLVITHLFLFVTYVWIRSAIHLFSFLLRSELRFEVKSMEHLTQDY